MVTVTMTIVHFKAWSQYIGWGMKMETECLVEACDVEMKLFGWSVLLRAVSTVPVWEEAAIMINDNGKDKLVIYNGGQIS